MSHSNILRPIAVSVSHASNSAPWTFSRIGRAWKLALEIVRESRAMAQNAWNSNRLPYNGW
jgi:hypothetical protein